MPKIKRIAKVHENMKIGRPLNFAGGSKPMSFRLPLDKKKRDLIIIKFNEILNEEKEK